MHPMRTRTIDLRARDHSEFEHALVRVPTARRMVTHTAGAEKTVHSRDDATGQVEPAVDVDSTGTIVRRPFREPRRHRGQRRSRDEGTPERDMGAISLGKAE